MSERLTVFCLMWVAIRCVGQNDTIHHMQTLPILPETLVVWRGVGGDEQYFIDTAIMHQRLNAERRCRQATNWLRIESSGLYDSNALRNDLVLGLRRGDVLSEDLRRNTQDGLRGNNRAGYALDFRASYSWGDSLFGDGSLRPMISVAHHDVMGMRFTDDVYNLTFFGNTQYENETASLGGTAFTQVTYQTFGFGFQHAASNSFLRLELVNGQRMNSAVLRQADLFTATDGRFLHLDLDGSYARSDTAQYAFGTSNGIGLALSASVEKRISLLGTAASVQLTVTDLGFIAWNGNAERIVNNSTINYEGIEVENIFDLDGVVLDQAELQDTIGLGYERGAFAQLLPTMVEARVQSGGHGKFCIAPARLYVWEIRIDQRNLPGYTPHLSITKSFLGHQSLRPEIAFSTGGFGGTRLGIGVQWNASPGLQVLLRVPNAIGPLAASGRGAAFTFGVDVAL